MGFRSAPDKPRGRTFALVSGERGARARYDRRAITSSGARPLERFSRTAPDGKRFVIAPSSAASVSARVLVAAHGASRAFDLGRLVGIVEHGVERLLATTDANVFLGRAALNRLDDLGLARDLLAVDGEDEITARPTRRAGLAAIEDLLHADAVEPHSHPPFRDRLHVGAIEHVIEVGQSESRDRDHARGVSLLRGINGL